VSVLILAVALVTEYEQGILEMVKGLDLNVGKNNVEVVFSFDKIVKMTKTEEEDEVSNEAVDGGDEDCYHKLMEV
jgi:hypothetical protein